MLIRKLMFIFGINKSKRYKIKGISKIGEQIIFLLFYPALLFSINSFRRTISSIISHLKFTHWLKKFQQTNTICTLIINFSKNVKTQESARFRADCPWWWNWVRFLSLDSEFIFFLILARQEKRNSRQKDERLFDTSFACVMMCCWMFFAVEIVANLHFWRKMGDATIGSSMVPAVFGRCPFCAWICTSDLGISYFLLDTSIGDA